MCMTFTFDVDAKRCAYLCSSILIINLIKYKKPSGKHIPFYYGRVGALMSFSLCVNTGSFTPPFKKYI